MRHAPITVVCASLLLLLGACSDGKATEAECAQFSIHFESLMAGGHGSPEAGKTAQLAKDMARDLRDRCLVEGTSAQVSCALAADSMAALQSCSEPK